MRTAALALVVLALGCSQSKDAADHRPEDREHKAEPDAVDGAALRAAAVDGLEAAVDAPEVARAFERSFETIVVEPVVVEASERMLARVGADEATDRAADGFFAQLQDSEAVRAALVAYARENPDLDTAALAEGFVAYVDVRLTRPELAEALRRTLEGELASVGGALGRALMVEAGGAEALADVYTLHFAEGPFSNQLRERAGDDAHRLESRLADGERQAALVLDFAGVLADAPTGHDLIAGILDDPATADAVADGLRHLMRDDAFRAATGDLLELALADEPDLRAFERALDELLRSPAVVREAAALLGTVARSESSRELVASFVLRYGERESVDALLLECLD